MSDANIKVTIRDNARKAAKRIRKRLRSINKERIRANLDIKDGDIDKTRKKLKTLSGTQSTRVYANIDKTSFARARMAQNGLKNSSVGINAQHRDFHGGNGVTRGGVDGSRRGQFMSNKIRPASIQNAVSAKGWSRNSKTGQMVAPDGNFGNKPDTTGTGGLKMNRPDFSARKKLGPIHGPKQAQGIEKVTNRIRKFGDSLSILPEQVNENRTKVDELGGSFKKFGNNLRKYTPNIMMWWKVVAILLPMIIILRIQMMGLGVAMYSVVGAGAAMMGLGLIGHGEGIADSFGLAERQMNKFKRELFQTFKPALSEFAPISWQFMDEIPQRLAPLVEPLRGITVFEDAGIEIFEAGIDMAVRLIEKLTGLAPELKALAGDFVELANDRAFRFLDFIIDTALEQRGRIDALLDTFGAIVNIIWQILKLVTTFLAITSTIWVFFSKVATFLSNDFIAPIVVAVATFYALSTAITSATAAWAGLNLAMSAGVIAKIAYSIGALTGAVSYLTAQLWNAVIAMGTLKGIATLGLSAAAGVASYRMISSEVDDIQRDSSGHNSGGNTINNEFHVHGDDAKSAGRELQDKFPEMYEEQQRKNDSQGSSGI